LHSSQFSLKIGKQQSNLKEFIHSIQLRLERVGVTHIDFYLEQAADIVDYRSTKKQSRTSSGNNWIDNVFSLFESINYAHSSSYNL
jgi:hypothetical protein